MGIRKATSWLQGAVLWPTTLVINVPTPVAPRTIPARPVILGGGGLASKEAEVACAPNVRLVALAGMARFIARFGGGPKTIRLERKG
jgi:hypothetical protein